MRWTESTATTPYRVRGGAGRWAWNSGGAKDAGAARESGVRGGGTASAPTQGGMMHSREWERRGTLCRAHPLSEPHARPEEECEQPSTLNSEQQSSPGY